MVTPSDQVDQVWHLHLVYTHSYWSRMCQGVLRVPLQHGPTRGGSAQRAIFADSYAQTLLAYRRVFEQTPPTDIWPSVQDRFSRDLAFVRVNTTEHWLVPKSRLTGVGIRARLRAISLSS
jgi:hypothetical protein